MIPINEMADIQAEAEKKATFIVDHNEEITDRAKEILIEDDPEADNEMTMIGTRESNAMEKAADELWDAKQKSDADREQGDQDKLDTIRKEIKKL